MQSVPRQLLPPLNYGGHTLCHETRYASPAMRLALLQGTSLRLLGPELFVLAGFCTLLLPASLIFFSYTLQRARIQGTLSFY